MLIQQGLNHGHCLSHNFLLATALTSTDQQQGSGKVICLKFESHARTQSRTPI